MFLLQNFMMPMSVMLRRIMVQHVVTACVVHVESRQDVQVMVPDAAQDEQLLEGRQEMQAVGQLHLVGLRAVI